MAKVRLNDLRTVRKALRASQRELARLLGVSARAVQSYEQGWRPTPEYVQKLAVLFLSLKWQTQNGKTPACWNLRECRPRKRADCPAYQFGNGRFCWMVKGACCEGEKESWDAKLARCNACDAMRPWLTY